MSLRFGKTDPNPPTPVLTYEKIPTVTFHGVPHKSCSSCASLRPAAEFTGELCAACAPKEASNVSR